MAIEWVAVLIITNQIKNDSPELPKSRILKFKPVKIWIILPMLLLTITTSARSNVIPGTGRTAAMANAFVSQSGIDAALHNPAGVASLHSLSGGAFFENRFMLKELSSQGIIVGIPIKKGVFATSMYTFGPAKWLETNLSLAYSMQLTPKLAGGIQFNYLDTKLPEENKTVSTAGAEVGFIYQFSPMLFAGIHVANPFSIPFEATTYDDKIPYRIGIGGHSPITSSITISAEAEKTENEPIVFRTGMEWEAVNNFFIRGGYSSGTTKLHAGIGFLYRFITADIAFGYHQTLGVTPSVSIKFNMK